MRKKLGVKRHLKLIAVQNNSMQWESYIYQMKVRESDSKRVPMKGISKLIITITIIITIIICNYYY